jgi:hypothetical protein
VGLENSVRWLELRLRLKRSSDQQLFLSAFASAPACRYSLIRPPSTVHARLVSALMTW